jgi:hypothetical protein
MFDNVKNKQKYHPRQILTTKIKEVMAALLQTLVIILSITVIIMMMVADDSVMIDDTLTMTILFYSRDIFEDDDTIL